MVRALCPECLHELIVVLGLAAISQMRTDIFPEIDIPVVTVIWTYKGMESSEVERRIGPPMGGCWRRLA